jgi:hypothetical protein
MLRWSLVEANIGDLALQGCDHRLHLEELLCELLLLVLGLCHSVDNFGELRVVLGIECALNAINYLLYQISIVLFKFGGFECKIGSLSILAMRDTEIVFEGDPGLRECRAAVPCFG